MRTDGVAVTMPSLLIEELKAWRAQQAQELLRLGIRADGSTRIVSKTDGTSPKPQSLTDCGAVYESARQ